MPTHDHLSYAVHTLGCKLNTYDTSWLQQHLHAQGFLACALEQGPDIVLVNTCAVTEQAVREACRWVRKIKKQHPHCFMVLTGCAAQVDAERLARSQGVDLVVGNSHKNQLGTLIRQSQKLEKRNQKYNTSETDSSPKIGNKLDPTVKNLKLNKTTRSNLNPPYLQQPKNIAPIFQHSIFKSQMQTPLQAITPTLTTDSKARAFGTAAENRSTVSFVNTTDHSLKVPLSQIRKSVPISMPQIGLEAQHTRAFLKIQDGCNSFCTFCIIPFARGKSKSLSIDQIVDQANFLHSQGVQEVVLTGVHIGDYCDPQNNQSHGEQLKGDQLQSGKVQSVQPQGRQLQKICRSNKAGDLATLVENLLARTRVPRFRLSSLEPIELSPALMQCFKDERLCPHFHMSVQSANTKVLKLMKRQYGQQQVCQALEMIHRQLPHAFVGLDIIAGFVGEGEAEFNDTYDTLARLPWTALHVFPYSPRQQTWAFNKPAPIEKVRRQRAARLRALGIERYDRHARQQVGTVKQALFLKKSSLNKIRKALSRDYWSIECAPVDKHTSEEHFFRITAYHKARPNGIGLLKGVQV